MALGKPVVAQLALVLFYAAAANLIALPLVTTAARADVASAMDGYFSDMGAAANVTGPTAFQGQSAGSYSLGNVWTRFPQKTVNLANIQLPGARAGCGGIDLFAGSFSFINASQLVAMMKAVANNAVGFAFKLAIDTVCPECSKVMEEMRQAAQLMNNQGISTCQAAAGIVGSMWPVSDAADKEICQQFANSTGKFTDWAASMAGCGPGGQRSATLDQAKTDPAFKDVDTGVARNYTWEVLKKSPFFAPGGTIDRELAEYVMTMVGTLVYVPPKDGGTGVFNPIQGDSSSALVTALLDGTDTGSTVKIWQCDASEDGDACLNPTLGTLSVPASKALRPRVAAMLTDMVGAIVADTAISAQDQGLLQMVSIPLYKILTVNAAYGRGLTQYSDDRSTLAEISSVDLLLSILDQLTGELGKSNTAFIAADKDRLAQWQGQFLAARQSLVNRQSNVQARVSGILQIVQRAQYLEGVLQSQMSPGMTASLDWSRAVQGHGIN